MSVRAVIRACLLTAAVSSLGGCTAAALLDTYGAGIFQDKKVNVTEVNYAAADYMVQQFSTFIRRSDLVKVMPLIDVEEPVMRAPVAKTIPEQVGVRLSQLGYKVDLVEVTTVDDQNYLRPSPEELSLEPDFLLSGTYARRRLDLEIKLRITDSRTSRVVATYDYMLPLNPEIAKMATPETQIFKAP